MSKYKKSIYIPTQEEQFELIDNPAGLPNHSKSYSVPDSIPRLSKKEIRIEIRKMKEIIQLGKKEEKFLNELSDLNLHKIEDLRSKTKTKACSKLKQRLCKKIKKMHFNIKTIKTTFANPHSYYQLEYLP